jgi:CBS domain-containing protein
LDVKTKLVKDLMVPLSEYATVSQDATLSEAVAALRQAQADFDQNKYRHRAILIYDENNRIVGKVNFQALLKGLEPKYDDMLSDEGPSHLGFTRTFQKSIIDQFKLWQDPLNRICEKASKIQVKSFMATPRPEEKIAADTTLDTAIHFLVMGHHQSLMVTEQDKVVGVLRLTDVFEFVADKIMTCTVSD